MNLGHLRRFLASAEAQALPDSTPVGGCGHYGELCPTYCDDIEIKAVKVTAFKGRMITAVILPTADIGPEPD